MGVFTHEEENTSAVPPARLFKALVLDSDTLVPKVAPDAGKGVAILEGDGGPGTIKKITFPDGKYVKHKIDSIDHDNFCYCYSLIEGDALSAEVEKICHEIKLVAAPGGGSTIKAIIKTYTVGDAPLDEEKAKEGKEKAIGLFKLVEGYLLANPDAYN